MTPSLDAVILLVEDDAAVRGSVYDFLEDHGHHTAVASTVREAVEYLRLHTPRVCILDLNLPDGSGIDVLNELRRRNLDSRVVVMTAFPVHPLQPAESNTPVAWLTKPVAPDRLLQAVETALDGGATPADPRSVRHAGGV